MSRGAESTATKTGLYTTPPPPPSQDEPVSDDLVGRVISGTYRIVRVIGEGGTGRVYEAHHTRIGSKRFAMKVLHAEFASHPDAWLRFHREAEAAGAIDHPNVVDVYDVDRTEEGRPYVVYEYLEGIELGALIEQRGPLSPRQAARIAQQVCAGLAAAHARGVIHRDVKPANIWLLGDLKRPEVKVLDFGISRLRDDAATKVTKTGAILGTPAYMSPEQAKGLRVDTPSDVYGAGTVLYASLTGRAPFEEDNVQGTLLAVMSAEPERPRAIAPILPESLELIIQRAMAKEPEDRFPTVEALAEALEEFVDPELPSMRPAPPSLPPPAESASRGMLAAMSVAALVVALMVAATVAVGVAQAVGGARALTDRELVLVLLALVGTALTPALLWVRYLRRSVWGNSVKVQEMLLRLRKVLLASVAAYGLSALSVRLIDTVGARFFESTLVGAAGGPAWVPLNVVFAASAVVAAIVAAWQERRRASRARFPWVAPIVGVLLVLGGVYGGLRWRASALDVATLEVALTEVPGVRSEDAAALALQSARVGDEELAEAVAHGREALESMRERFPRDPAVLQALALAYGADEATYPLAVQTLERLFEQEPELTQDRALRFVVSKAAQSPESRDAALALMVTAMNGTGLDLLYEVWLTHEASRPKIETMLANPKIADRLSPALSIAYDLRRAEGCAAVLPLLDRAARHGDERAIAVLAPLTEGTERGCGPWKRRPCDPPCPDEAERISEAVGEIRARLGQ